MLNKNNWEGELCFAHESIEQLEINEKTKLLLSNCGLPKNTEYFRGYPNSLHIGFERMQNEIRPIPYEKFSSFWKEFYGLIKNFYLIGDQLPQLRSINNYVCLDSETEHLLMVRMTQKPEGFEFDDNFGIINSSVKNFMNSLLIYKDCYPKIIKLPHNSKEKIRMIEMALEDIYNIDPVIYKHKYYDFWKFHIYDLDYP